MNSYVLWVKAHPLASAALQFALLGPLGEVLAASCARRRPSFPFGPVRLLLKMAAWAVLGIVIKYGFAGMKGFVHALVDGHFLPAAMGAGLGGAFAVSLFTNILFGPQMMAFHRVEDNLITGDRGFAGLERAWWTLIWFWIPAHTVTFCLPTEYQIGLAAVWGTVLGLILGLSKGGARKAWIFPTIH
ncbi:MAG: hypothetical protein ABSH53_04775 [Holophaga sp.]|jgi:hypothetical protein